MDALIFDRPSGSQVARFTPPLRDGPAGRNWTSLLEPAVFRGQVQPKSQETEMPATTHTPKQPSKKQLNLLRRLASEKGQTFAYPASSAQASAEIRRLLGQTSSTRVERNLDRRAV